MADDVPHMVIFMAHFTFTSLCLLGSWAGTGYIFYNAILLLLIVWSMHDQTTAKYMKLALLVNATAVALDIFYLAYHFPSSIYYAQRFSAVIAILHMISRPFSSLYMVKIIRSFREDPNFLGRIIPTPVSGYEDIDQTQETRPPRNSEDWPEQI